MGMVNECGHPERPHAARNKCESCYQIWYRATNPGPRKATATRCHPDRPHKAYGLCSQCWRRTYYERNKEQQLARHREYYAANRRTLIDRAKARNRERQFGITESQFEQMKQDQGGACAICGQEPKKWAIDHDHDTDKVRALLCTNCNVGIGMLQDDPVILSAAAQYVYMHKPLVAVA